MPKITRRAALALGIGAATSPAEAVRPLISGTPVPPPTAAYACPLAEVMLVSHQRFVSGGIMWIGDITRHVAELTGYSLEEVNGCWSREPGSRDHLADRDAFCTNLAPLKPSWSKSEDHEVVGKDAQDEFAVVSRLVV